MSAFHDRARTVRFLGTGARVEGRLVRDTVPTLGPWFRCYYDTGEEGEQAGDGGYRRRRSSSVIARPRDTLGGAVDVEATDVLEIESVRDGHLFLEVVGAPRALGKRRARVIEMTVAKTNRDIST